MRYRILAAMLACTTLLIPALRAEGTEPQVYFFWSASCPYSKAARTFLAAAQAKEPRLRIRDFEVDESAANLRLLGRVYDRIGMPGLMVVPAVVVGHHVVIGYIDDETTGAEILGDVAECRKTGCKDTVQDLIEDDGRLDGVASAAPTARIDCEKGAVRKG
jgi:hypothetical protein